MKYFRQKLLPTAVRLVELDDSIQPIIDVTEYQKVWVYVTRSGNLLGKVEIHNWGRAISAARLRQAIAINLTQKVVDTNTNRGDDLPLSKTYTAIGEQFLQPVSKQYPNGQLIPFSQNFDGFIPTWLIDLSKTLNDLEDTAAYDWVRLIISWHEQPLGSVDINNRRQPLIKDRLRYEIINSFAFDLLWDKGSSMKSWSWAKVQNQLAENYFNNEEKKALSSPKKLPKTVPVSIVIATLDRPDDLQECLLSLINQETERDLEIIVVDNNPDSGLTPPVVAQFNNVHLVQEPRRGLAYARNAGFVVSTGAIVIATDDDVLFPINWLERLVAPFARQDVMIVTGNVLPKELETESQQLFELYGGLGRGFERLEVNGDWFEKFRFKAVPTWELGATANAAFRSSIFHDPNIRMLEESLGPGTPSGVGEDTHLFYRVLKAGWTIIYEPHAYVWHKHRRTMAALRGQLYAYSKGHIAYHLKLFLTDNDWRGLTRIFVEMPLFHFWRIKERLMGRSAYPLSLLRLEIKGYLAGYFVLWKSLRRVRRLGRSDPYIPPELRPNNYNYSFKESSSQKTKNLGLVK